MKLFLVRFPLIVFLSIKFAAVDLKQIFTEEVCKCSKVSSMFMSKFGKGLKVSSMFKSKLGNL